MGSLRSSGGRTSQNPYSPRTNDANDLLTGLGPPNADAGGGAPPPPSYHDALRSPVQRGERQQAGEMAQNVYSAQVNDAVNWQQQQQAAAAQAQAQEQQRREEEDRRRQAQAAAQAGPARRNSIEDPLAPLRRYHVLFLVDDSPSMSEGDLWQQVTQALQDILASAVKYDRDLPDIHFMNNEDRSIIACSGPDQLVQTMRSIQLHGSTPTGYRIDDILRPYVERVEDSRGRGVGGTLNQAAPGERVKPQLLVVFTDGRADDPEMVRDVIVEFAQRLTECRAPPTQLGLQFVQIGNDPEATEFLQNLDDDIQGEHGVRDMVDTTPYQGRMDSTFLAKALLGAINRRLDATGESANRRASMAA